MKIKNHGMKTRETVIYTVGGRDLNVGVVLTLRSGQCNELVSEVSPFLAPGGGLDAFSLPSLATFPRYSSSPDCQGHVECCSATGLRDVAAFATSGSCDPSGTQSSGEAQCYEQGLLEVHMWGSWRGFMTTGMIAPNNFPIRPYQVNFLFPLQRATWNSIVVVELFMSINVVVSSANKLNIGRFGP